MTPSLPGGSISVALYPPSTVNILLLADNAPAVSGPGTKVVRGVGGGKYVVSHISLFCCTMIEENIGFCSHIY